MAKCDRNYAPYYALGKLLEKSFAIGGNPLQALFALGGMLIAVVLLVAGVAVAIVLLVGIVVLLVWICRRVAKWNRRRLAKKRYCVFSKFLTTESQIIKKKTRLDSLLVTSAKVTSGAIAGDCRAEVCWSKRSPTTLSFQLQAKQDNCLKCVHVVLEQVGKDIVARADWAACASSYMQSGYDFSSKDAEGRVSMVPIATSEDEKGYGVVNLRFRTFSKLKPIAMPISIWKDGLRSRWGASCSVPKTLKISTASCEGANSGEIILKVESEASRRPAEVVWRNPEGDWGEKYGGTNMAKANVLMVRARGENGGEKVFFFMGGLKNRMVSDTADEHGRMVCLKKKWKTYCIPLHGIDLTRVKTAFGLRIEGLDASMAFYVCDVVYRHSWWRAIVFGLGKVFCGLGKCFRFTRHSE